MDHDLINKTIDGCGCFLLPLTGIKRVGGRGKRTQPWSQCAQAHSPRCKPASAAAYNAHAGTRRHGKTTCRRQYKARRDETRQDEAGRDKTRQDKTNSTCVSHPSAAMPRSSWYAARLCAALACIATARACSREGPAATEGVTPPLPSASSQSRA